MTRTKFEDLSPKEQLEVAENFESNGITGGTYGADDANESYRRDENGLEEMEDPSETGGFAPGKSPEKKR